MQTPVARCCFAELAEETIRHLGLATASMPQPNIKERAEMPDGYVKIGKIDNMVYIDSIGSFL